MIKDLKEELKKEKLILDAKSKGLIVEDYKLYASENKKNDIITISFIALIFLLGIMLGSLAAYAEFYTTIMLKFFGS